MEKGPQNFSLKVEFFIKQVSTERLYSIYRYSRKEKTALFGRKWGRRVSICWTGNWIEKLKMDFWPEFLASSWGKEFVAGGLGGTAGIVAGYPLDTLRIRQQNSRTGSAFSILRRVVTREGPCALYRGMGAPLASVFFQVLTLHFLLFTKYVLKRFISTNLLTESRTDTIFAYAK